VTTKRFIILKIYRITKKLPWNAYARKNVGYLYAIQHGAKIIYDIDDDNVIVGDSIVHHPEVTTTNVLNSSYHLVNPYGYFGKADIWPRGFPLEAIRNRCTTVNTAYFLYNLN
jgi:hypothetical protein